MTSPSLESLQQRFGIEGTARIEAGAGGLPRVCVTTPFATAHIYLHGAQVTSWRPAGQQEVLFLSRQSAFAEGRAIRGGIPVCFPWFRAKADDPKAPAHGVVRTRQWQLDAVQAERNEAEQDTVVVTLSTRSDEASRVWWPYEFHLEHRVSVGRELRLELTVTNTGDGALRFEEALHSYFRVSDATEVRVSGLDGAAYLDNVDANREKLQQGDVSITGPTDNAYLDTGATLELFDPSPGRRLRTRKGNSMTTVVWNPWRQGAAALGDMADDEWREMACVEASNILGAAVTLAPGSRHTMLAALTLEE